MSKSGDNMPESFEGDDAIAALIDHGAEQAIIGNVLAEPKCFDLCAWLKPEHFGLPVHGAIWNAIKTLRQQGRDFGPTYLSQFFADDPSIKYSGGADYLVNLAQDALAPVATTKDHAARILSLHYRRMALVAGEKVVALAKKADFETPPEKILTDLETMLAEARTFRTGDNIASAGDVAANALQLAKNPTYGIKTGLSWLDKITGGFKPSQLIVVGARPGMGKTALGLTISANAAKAGKQVLFFSLEMSKEDLLQRVISRYSRQAVHSGDIHDHEAAEKAADEVSKLPLYIDDAGGITALDVAARASAFKRRNGLDMIVVDYLGLVKALDSRAQKVHQVEEITQAFKNLAKSLKVPLVLLCQLSRSQKGSEGTPPVLSDLRDSGAIEQDADVVVLIHRKEYYTKPADDRYQSENSTAAALADDAADKGKAELIIAKHRQGRLDTVFCKFSGEGQYFHD